MSAAEVERTGSAPVAGVVSIGIQRCTAKKKRGGREEGLIVCLF